MKRDMDLVRLLLLEQESGEAPTELENYSQEDQVYHLALMADANLIDANLILGGNGDIDTVNVSRLTWAGHDFLDATRDSKVWTLAKEKVLKPGASFTFSLLVEWLKQEAHKQIFGTHGP